MLPTFPPGLMPNNNGRLKFWHVGSAAVTEGIFEIEKKTIETKTKTPEKSINFITKKL